MEYRPCSDFPFIPIISIALIYQEKIIGGKSEDRSVSRVAGGGESVEKIGLETPIIGEDVRRRPGAP
jgi:hypothetical protein